MKYSARAFTVVEVIVIVVIISLLATITIAAYGSWQRSTAKNTVKADLLHAASIIKSVHNFKNTYPTSIFAKDLSSDGEPGIQPSENVTMSLKTNAIMLPVYSNLSQAQNSQLFLDACNSAMPVTSTNDGTIYHSSCYSFITGLLQFRIASNGRTAYIANPIQENFSITCSKFLGSCNESDYNAVTTAAVSNMKERFSNQGGTYPVSMPLLFNGAVLPDPSSSYTENEATKYCAEAVSKKFPDIIYHIKSSSPSMPQSGSCPANSDTF